MTGEGSQDPVPQPQPAGVLAPGTVIDDRFRIEAHLAQGGMGDVYRAEHIYMKRPVALKLLRPEWAAQPEMATRFQREAQVVSQLDHPHIVRIFDFGRTQSGLFFLAMEFVEGPSLEAHLKGAGALPVSVALRLLSQLCSALVEAHARGIIHRDLKPENVIMGAWRPGSEGGKAPGEPCLKVLDFGIARLADAGGEGAAGLTQLGMVLGTPEYLSPEQALAQPLDPRTDLYSLSVIAFRMLAGRLPFISASPLELVSLQVSAAPPSLVELRPELARHPALCELVQRGLAKDREARMASATEYTAGLVSAEVEASRVVPEAPPQPLPLEMGRPTGLTAALQPNRLPGRSRTQNLTVVFTDIKDFTARTSRQTREQNRRVLEVHDRLVRPVFKGYRGRVVKTIGDAFLVAFGSPTDALLSAMALQDRLAEHNAKAPEAEQLQLRVAINLGEVTVTRGDVFGEAVNVAARVEGIAEVGAIFFTEAVYLAMSRSEIPHELVGTHTLRGVDVPVRTYRVRRVPGLHPYGGWALEPLRSRLRWSERRALLASGISHVLGAVVSRSIAAVEWVIDGLLAGPLSRRLQALGAIAVAMGAIAAMGLGVSRLERRAPEHPASAAVPAPTTAPPAAGEGGVKEAKEAKETGKRKPRGQGNRLDAIVNELTR